MKSIVFIHRIAPKALPAIARSGFIVEITSAVAYQQYIQRNVEARNLHKDRTSHFKYLSQKLAIAPKNETVNINIYLGSTSAVLLLSIISAISIGNF